MGAPVPARPRLAVVIPMFNEEAGAALCVDRVTTVIRDLAIPARLIVVNDGSTDGTSEVLATCVKRHPSLQVVQHPANAGYGAALRSGAEAAAARDDTHVLFMDSDLTNAPEDIPRFVEQIERGIDVVKGTRYRPGGGMRGVPLRRQIVSRTGALIARILFHAGVSDCTNGFRAVRTSLLMQLRLRERRFPVIVEELYCCIFVARTFADVPVILTNRADALRPTSFAYRPSIFWGYLKYALLACFRVPPGDRIRGASLNES